MSKTKMIRADLDYELLGKKADTDLVIANALRGAAKQIKYNSRLYDFMDMAYPWQRDAIRMTKDNRVVGLIAANQVGKSETAMSIVACLSTGIIPDWWQGRKYDRPVKIMVAGVDSNHSKNVLMDKLIGTNNWRMKNERGSGQIPRDFIIEESAVTVRGDDLSSIKIKHVSGQMSEIIFRSYSQGREAAQGFQADIIVIDEQPNDDFWSEALVRTAATGGFVVCSFTPLKGLTGLVEQLMQLQPVSGAPSDAFGPKYRQDSSWAMVRASWDDITHISEVDKEQLRKGFAAYEADARMFGMPIAGHGRIFPHQRETILYDPRETIVPERFEHLIGIDIGHGQGRDPSAAVLVAWDTTEDIVYVREANLESTDTTNQLSKLIMRTEHRCPVAWPSDAGRQSMNADASVAEQLRNLDVDLLGKPFVNPKGADGKRNNFKAPGIQEINQRFSEGRLKISISCDDLLKEIENYSYTESGKIQDGKDHCIDAMRYAVMSIIQGHGTPLKLEEWSRYDDWDDEYHYSVL